MGDKREDHDCVQRLELSFFITTINKFYVHKKGQTICTIFFLLQCFHKKRKTWGLSTTVLAHPMSFDVFLSCLVQRNITFIDVCGGTPDALQILIQMPRYSRSISMLERNDENIFITRLWWSSPQAAWRVNIFSSLEQDVRYVFYIFLHFNLRSVHIS